MDRNESYLHHDYNRIRPLDGDLVLDSLNWILKTDKKEKVVLLEPGCGSGRVLKILSQHDKVSLFGVDIIPKLVSKAKMEVGGNHRIKSGDFLTYDFRDERFDYILFSHYFHHLPNENVPRHIKRATSLLKSDGRILFLFEDCAYYSFLLGKPPATPNSHPLSKLHGDIQKDPNLKRIFKCPGPYLPSELLSFLPEGEQLHMAPFLRYSNVKKKIVWPEECDNKSASIFHKLSYDRLTELKMLGKKNKFDPIELPVQPYIFYSEGRLSDSTMKAKKVNFNNPIVEDENISRTVVSYLLQNTIQNACLPHKAAFLSVYLTRLTARDRDVYYGGELPKAELSYWYHNIYDAGVADLISDVPELSPSYLKGKKIIYKDPFPIKAKDENDFRKSLLKIYKTYNVEKIVRDKFDNYSKKLWDSLESLNRLLKLVGTQLDSLYYREIKIGKHSKHGFPVLLTLKKPSVKEVRAIEVILDWFEKVDPKIKEEQNIYEEIKSKIRKDADSGKPWFSKKNEIVKHNLQDNSDLEKTADYLIDAGLVLPSDFKTNTHFYNGLKYLLLTDETRWISSIYALFLIAVKQKSCGNIESMKNYVCIEDTRYPRITEDGLKYLYNFFINIVKHEDDSDDTVSECIPSESSFTIKLKYDFMKKVLETTTKILLQKPVTERHDTSKPLADFINESGWRLSICDPSEGPCYIFNHEKDNGSISIWSKNKNSYISFSRCL